MVCLNCGNDRFRIVTWDQITKKITIEKKNPDVEGGIEYIERIKHIGWHYEWVCRKCETRQIEDKLFAEE